MGPSAAPSPARPQDPVGATLDDVAVLTGARIVGTESTGATVADRLTGITLRAQDVHPGDLFAALPGSRAHGAQYATQALDRGARAVLTDQAGADLLAGSDEAAAATLLVVDRPREHLGALARRIYGDPSSKLAVVGITGTSGKTTTCYLLEAALAANGSRSAVIGTVQTRIDGVVTPSALTTPEAPDLQALLALMVERGVSAVAMEVSSHALALGRVSGTRFAVGAFTNLSQDHLDFHHDMEEYFRAKGMLFDGRAGRHVVDVDTDYGARLAAQHPEALTVSDRAGAADWSVAAVTVATNGVQHVTLTGPGDRTVTLDLAIPGAFNVGNAAVALACVDALGRDVQQAADALSAVVVPGRMERVDAGQDFLAVVDYAHKPGAVAAVLDAIADGLAGPLVVVLGAGGDRDPGKRPLMGAESAARADLLIVTDDNPRSEPPGEIRAQVLAGARPPAARRGVQVLEIGDRRAAIRRAVQVAGTGGAVVIAGKGHEQGQEIAGVVHPFSDRDELRAALVDLIGQPPTGRALSDGPTSVHRVSDAPPDRTRRPTGPAHERSGMIAMTLAQIADAIGAHPPAGSEDVMVWSVEFDTRRVRPGALFVALRGDRVDGHDFAGAAGEAGAVAVLGCAPIDAAMPLLRVDDRPDNAAVLDALAALARVSVTALVNDHGLQVIGVTGSSGKTSTKDLIAAVLRGAVAEPEQVIAPPESFNNELGHPYTALRAEESTRYLVLELSARGVGHIAALARVAPLRIGAVINVGSAHIGEFGSVGAIAKAKSELVQALPPASDIRGAGGVAILNADDPLVAGMAELTDAEVVMVGTTPGAVIRAEDIDQDDAGRSGFTLVTPEGSARVALRVVGAHQVGNALTAAAVGRAVGMSVDAVAQALSAARAASRWRMEVTELANGATLINDAYNANPHSMKAALHSLSTIGRGRRTWAVLGEMAELGDEAIAAHDEIGRLVVRLGIDRLLVVAGPGAATGAAVGGRTAPRALHLGAHLEGSWGGESELVPDIDEAVAVLLEELEPGDVVLVKASRSAGLERVALALIDTLGGKVVVDEADPE